MRTSDIKALDRRPSQMLAGWWCELNRYECPKPFQPMNKDDPRRREIMNFIVEILGKRVCIAEWERYHNTRKPRRKGKL